MVTVAVSRFEVWEFAVLGSRGALHAVGVTVWTDHERIRIIVIKSIMATRIWNNKEIKRVVIDYWCLSTLLGVIRHFTMISRHYVFCDTHWSNLRFIGLFFQNALVDHIGVYTDTKNSVIYSNTLHCNRPEVLPLKKWRTSLTNKRKCEVTVMAGSILVPSAIYGSTNTTEHVQEKNVALRKLNVKISASLVPEKSEAGQ